MNIRREPVRLVSHHREPPPAVQQIRRGIAHIRHLQPFNRSSGVTLQSSRVIEGPRVGLSLAQRSLRSNTQRSLSPALAAERHILRVGDFVHLERAMQIEYRRLHRIESRKRHPGHTRKHVGIRLQFCVDVVGGNLNRHSVGCAGSWPGEKNNRGKYECDTQELGRPGCESGWGHDSRVSFPRVSSSLEALPL